MRLFCGYLVQVCPFAILGFYPFTNQLRYSKKKAIISTGIFLLLLAFLFSFSGTYLYAVLPHDNSLFLAANIIFLLCLIPCFLWLIYISLASWEKKLFIFSFTLTSALALVSICNMFISWIYRNVETDGLPYKGWSSLIILVVSVVFLPLLMLLLEKCYMPIAEGLSQRENRYLAVLSLVLFLILASGLSFIDITPPLQNSMFLFLFFALLFSIFFIYLIYFKLLLSLHEKLLIQKHNQELHHQLEIRDEQYCRFTETIEGTRRMRHDFKHNLLILHSMNQEGKTQELGEYLNHYIQQLQEYEIVKLCDNAVINWVVSYYLAIAKELHLTFTTRISIPDTHLSIEDADLSVLLGNLLENALTAAKGVKNDGFIHFNMIHSGKMLAITLDNSFNGIVCKEEEHYRSTKKDHRGIGLQSIQSIAEKYNGGVEFSHEGTIFHASVMLKIQ
ncbi:MAG: ATP-binding protein [Lachnospiraceae bacterium]|nr:ATP-binding protein [Lachnospiraceae bacterium]